jgi:hypothetical protein
LQGPGSKRCSSREHRHERSVRWPRPKDLEDAIAVLRAQANHIVVERVRTTLALLERALDRKDLIPELERALLHVRRASQ